MKCTHGFDPADDISFLFVDAFQKSFDEDVNAVDCYEERSLFECLLHAKNATMDQFSDVWKDSTKMKTAISILLYAGTTALIEGEDHIARDSATSARFFEQYNATLLQQTHALMNLPKIDETYHTDEHTLVKFFWKRIPCSCLDEKYEEVKHITKMGHCYNPKCCIPGRKVERSKAKYCSRCRTITYCSQECQEAHWTDHKSDCDFYAQIIAKFEAKRQE